MIVIFFAIIQSINSNFYLRLEGIDKEVMAQKPQKSVHIISDTGADMMTLEKFGRSGEKMSVKGALMGSWSTEMFIEPEDVPQMIGMLFNPQVIGYIFSLPIILLKRSGKKKP